MIREIYTKSQGFTIWLALALLFLLPSGAARAATEAYASSLDYDSGIGYWHYVFDPARYGTIFAVFIQAAYTDALPDFTPYLQGTGSNGGVDVYISSTTPNGAGFIEFVTGCTSYALGGDCYPEGPHVTAYFPFLMTGSGPQGVVSDQRTRIISVLPVDKSTVASTTDTLVGITGFINPDDWVEGMVVSLHLTSWNCNGQATDVAAAFTTCVRDLEIHPGAGAFATTTTFNLSPWDFGTWNMTGRIGTSQYCLLGYCLSNKTLTSTSTSFIIGELSQTERVVASSTSFLKEVLQDEDVASCNPLSGHFDILRCLALLFVPDKDSITLVLSALHDNLLTLAPWGYLTRFAEIMTNNATSTLPTFTATFLTGANATTSLTFDMNDMLAGGSNLLDSIKDPNTGQNAKDIVLPIVQLIVFSGVVFYIVRDITHIHHHK